MVCSYCRGQTKVSNSRPTFEGYFVWRRRVCLDCQAVITTTEIVELESTITLDDKPLSLAHLIIELNSALKSPSDAQRLTKVVLVKILKTGQARLSQEALEKIIFQTLLPVDQKVALRYAALAQTLEPTISLKSPD